MISTIMSAITTRMMEMKLKQDKLDRNLEKAIQQQKLKAYQSKNRNTSRGVGKYMGDNINNIINRDV